MEVTPTTANAQQTASETSQAKLSKDIESFLTLLTTQLKHQDPLEPVDSTEFTAQLAQFAAVEQGIQTNANLEKLIAFNTANRALSAVGYIGKSVQAWGDTAALVNGQATFGYELPEIAESVALAIENEAGVPVLVTAGETSAGRHVFAWDGTDAQGVPLPEGKYTIKATAADAEGNPINIRTFTAGVVDGADTSGETVQLTINGVAVPLTEVITVKEAAPAT